MSSTTKHWVRAAAIPLLVSFLVRDSEQACQAIESTFSEFSVNSRRNETGHWISQISMLRPTSSADTATKNVPTLQFNVQHGDKHCGDQEMVYWVTTIIAPPPIAGPGYELYPGVGRYKLHTVPKTWAQARDICAKEGGHLAIVNSEKESKIFQDWFARYPTNTMKATHNDYVFIGIHDMYKEGEFITIFGDPLQSTGFTRWSAPGQPDNAGNNENCGSLHRNGGLNDIPCNFSLMFFCEQELW